MSDQQSSHVTSEDDSANLWCVADTAAILRLLDASQGGLTTAEAAERLARFGRNRLPESAPATLVQIFVRQFKNPLIYILAFAATLAAATGEVKDALFILAVLLINALLGSYHELRAEKSSRALQQLLRIRATVSRDGEVAELDAEELVPGDLVWLESGNRVPADMRLLGARGLQVDESLLTGESLPVVKNPDWRGEKNTPLADQQNMVFAGSMIVQGRSSGVVVATGAESAVGRVATAVMGADTSKPPLVERMERFSRKIGIAVMAAAIIVGVLGVLIRGYAISEMIMFAIALAVSAIPEGLPVALTVALAVASYKMSQRGVIIRRLAAVEGLGSCTLIASDKTGTLTVNELTATAISLPGGQSFSVSGQGFAPEGQVLVDDIPADLADFPGLERLLRAAVLCNEADLHRRDGEWTWRGDPTDIALLSMAHKAGIKRESMLSMHPQIDAIAFEPERQYAGSFHTVTSKTLVCVKGAPERIAKMCADREATEQLLAAAESMAEAGYRVLAFAEGELPAKHAAAAMPPEPADLNILGLVGMIDPLRMGVREAVAEASSAGVNTVMVTGDHPITALAIARNLGLADCRDDVVIGADLIAADSSRLAELVAKAKVFARVSPQQKVDIVQAARAAGHYVAVTGDGINDAAALRAANIGVAMGRAGTDVAREAAELVITDDHYATIVAGIEEGRVAYDNVRKVIYLLISTGAAEVVLVALAIIFGTPLPLLPAQLLWLNLVTNGIQDVALAFEPGEPGVLKRRPRPPAEGIFNRLMVERTLIGAIAMGGVAFAAFQWMLDQGWSEVAARNYLLLLMVLFENVHIFNARSELVSALRISPLKSPLLMGGALIAFLIHVSMLYLPWGQRLLDTAPVSKEGWGILVILALSILVVMELHKLYWNRFVERDSRPLPESSPTH
jgi:magnesium-transporting ATPase (P-type)